MELSTQLEAKLWSEVFPCETQILLILLLSLFLRKDILKAWFCLWSLLCGLFLTTQILLQLRD